MIVLQKSKKKSENKEIGMMQHKTADKWSYSE